MIALLVAAGAGIWIYGKIMRSTGNNIKNALVVACSGSVIVFLIMLFILKLIPSA